MAIEDKFHVFLKSNLPPLERKLLDLYCRRIVAESGEELLYLACTKIDASHFVYLAVEAIDTVEDITFDLQVRHDWVFFISGADSKAPIGF